MAAGLKYSYSQASSEDLDWMLGPVAAFVEFFTGAVFFKESGVGYVCASKQVAIVPACAGVNFLIAAFCMTTMTSLYFMQQKKYLPLCVLAGFAAAFGAALCANSLRIILSIYLYQADIYTAFITPERVHRVAGIVIYFMSLCLLYCGIRKFTTVHIFFGKQPHGNENGNFVSSLPHYLPPLFWYLTIALAVPAVNSAAGKNPALFGEHAATVVAVSLLLFMLMFLGAMCYKFKKQKQNQTDNCHETAHSDRGR